MGKHIAIVGCGGVGTWAAITTALAAKGQEGLVESIGLFDSDTLEAKNFARVPLAPSRVGYTKTEVVGTALNGMGFRNCKPGPAITAANITIALEPYDTVICCTDDVTNQRLVKTYCTDEGKTYQRAGYDGDTINVCRQMPLTFDVAAEAADAGYHGTPEVYHAALAGVLAVYSVLRSPVTIMGEVAKLVAADATHVPQGMRDAIIADGWADKASEEGWHPSDDCEIPDGYHHYEDCNHDDCHDECYTYDGVVESFFDRSARNVYRDLPDEVREYVVEQDGPTLADMVDNDFDAVVDELKKRHDATHTGTSIGCPWCKD